MSAIETYEHHPFHYKEEDVEPAYQTYIDNVPTCETKNGERTYNVLCFALKDEQTNEVCIVRKAHNVDSADPTDWLVVRYKEGFDQVITNGVIAVDIEKSEDGDTVHLQLSPEVSYHGPFTLRFQVDDLYHADDAMLAHQKYYGRGVGSESEEHEDAHYSGVLNLAENDEPIAEIIHLDEERRKRRPLGELAITGTR